MTTHPKEDNDDANGHRRAGAPDNGGASGTAGNSPGGPKIPSAAERFAAAIDDAIIAQLTAAGPGAGVTPPGQRFGAYPAGPVKVGPTPPAPKLPHAMQVGEIIGWRAWRVNHDGDPILRSVHMAHHWEPGETMSADVNPTQVKGRHSGIYACKTLNDLCSGQNGLELALLSTVAPVVIGKVALWGDTIEHATGYRAEHAKVSHLEAVLWSGHDEAKLLHDLRLRYGFGDDGHKPGQKVAPAAILPNGLGAPGTVTPMILSSPFPPPLPLRIIVTGAAIGFALPTAAYFLGWL